MASGLQVWFYGSQEISNNSISFALLLLTGQTQTKKFSIYTVTRQFVLAEIVYFFGDLKLTFAVTYSISAPSKLIFHNVRLIFRLWNKTDMENHGIWSDTRRGRDVAQGYYRIKSVFERPRRGLPLLRAENNIGI